MSVPLLQQPGSPPRPVPLPPPARAFERGRVVSGPRTRSASAFTLAEILIAITLMVLVGGLAISNFGALNESIKRPPLETVFREAVRDARYDAVLNKRSTLLAFDSDKNNFVITDYLTGNVISTTPYVPDNNVTKLAIQFSPILPLKDLMSGTDDTPNQFANTTLTQLMFHSSGASTPVKVDITVNEHNSTLFLDPFSEGPPPKAPLTP